MRDFVKSMLSTPTSHADPHYWASVLLAHAMLGTGGAILLPWWAAIAAYTAWEAAQWWWYDADPWDCALDWCGFTLGVVIAVTASPWAVLALLVVLIVGVRVRG
ncbi:hypothetical protein [Paracoccus sp. (in: a-proteobacteria)]|uniref:hypothetical protein n=1 Tax=Paracoccus sp. TaxID=267 RepID=UPI0026E0D3CC|nr:hypothetical protein [Paracoccus sp. (in: a-proteobacteria)]MDO5648837.1 hypothetical protein [Paracoccus sp. (in: a-proteobacteria)]